MSVRIGRIELVQRRDERKRDPARNRHHRLVAVDTVALRQELERTVRGEVRFDAAYRAAYSTDSSNYRQAPLGVVVPMDADDVAATITACRRHGAPVVPRGCGTSLAGQATNAGVVIDTSRHMRDIVSVDPQRRLARVQPGLARDGLAKHCEQHHGLTFPPDTSTHAYATFGGMIGNNSCGAHSVMTNRTSDNLESMEVLFYDGTRLEVGATGPDELQAIIAGGGRRGEVYRRLRDLADRYGDLVRERYPRIPRRVSGYNLDELLPENGFHVARALAGSEGTLCTILEATVRLTPWPAESALVVVGFKSIFDAADHVPAVMAHEPHACEAIDHLLISSMRQQGTHLDKLPLLPSGQGWLLVEFRDDSLEAARERAERFVRELEGGEAVGEARVYTDHHEEELIWSVREGGLGASAFPPLDADYYEGWEDAAVAPDRLGAYLRDFQELLDSYGYDTPKYGHFGQGLVHCRINFELTSAGGIRKFRAFLDDATDLVVRHGGVPSGEHGDGQSKAVLLERVYGRELVAAFGEMKAILDPEGRMNPGKVVDPHDPTDDLKLGTDYAPRPGRTHFSYPRDGGDFAHAANRCVGAGKCRDTSSGTMCPSFQATLDEEHTTRGRARVLFEMMRGETITDGWRSSAVFEALDLCLACKGCKGECPVHVDMATYKAEFLSKYYRRRLRPRHAYALGLIMWHARVAAHAPSLANLALRAPGLATLAKRAAGIAPERTAPAFAGETFRASVAGRPSPNPDAPAVVLFADTFTNHFEPHVGLAAQRVLEAAGRHVIVPAQPICCGRPLFDYGMVPTAKRFLRGALGALRPHIRAGTPVVVLEPSCCAVFRDELPNLFPHDQDALRLSLQTLTLAEYLSLHASDWPRPQLERDAILHGHCHQKAIMGMGATEEVLRQMGVRFGGEFGAGCCGLAGSFGYEADKYQLSMDIGERKLLPAVRTADPGTLILSDGFSCRSQVEHATERRGMHLAEALDLALNGDGAAGGHQPR